MPGFDGKGPMGKGPMTGGGRGLCARNLNRTDINVQGNVTADQSPETPVMGVGRGGLPYGGGMGRCFGGGRGRSGGRGLGRRRGAL